MTGRQESTSLLSLLLTPADDARGPERGVACGSALPAPSDPDLVERAARARDVLGDRLVILGHHYQRDEVIQFADITGDSLRLAQRGAENHTAEYFIFCGVHFMAETADILSLPEQSVLLPDSAAGCSMADMASLSQVEGAWRTLEQLDLAASTVPVAYVNSSAAIKAFVGQHGGATCTSSNAESVLRWAYEQGRRVLFLPDQHLGRNTAVMRLGMGTDDCQVFNPHQPIGGLSEDALRDSSLLLWKGHCSVHARFSVEAIQDARTVDPSTTVIVHPECAFDVVQAADLVGSTDFIIKTIAAAQPGTSWAVGTELNLVSRLAAAHPDKTIRFLDRQVCYCSTMNRIDLPHLVHTLEALAYSDLALNTVSVDGLTAERARLALDRMLALS